MQRGLQGLGCSFVDTLTAFGHVPMQTGPQLSAKASAEAFTAKTALERGGEGGKCHLEKRFGLLLALFFLGEPASCLEGTERRRESTVNFSSKYCTSNTGKKKSQYRILSCCMQLCLLSLKYTPFT